MHEVSPIAPKNFVVKGMKEGGSWQKMNISVVEVITIQYT